MEPDRGKDAGDLSEDINKLMIWLIKNIIS